MKNFVKYLLIISILFTPLQVTADEYSENKQETKTIQLTDYRYENAVNLLNGYTLLNYRDPYNKTNQGDIVLPSTVLKPDGSEMFKPGKYYISYIFHYEEYQYTSCFYPQNENADRYIVEDIDNITTDAIIDNNNNLIVDFTPHAIVPLYGKYYMQRYAPTDDNSFIYKIINGDTGKTIFTSYKDGPTYISENQERILFYIIYSDPYDDYDDWMFNYTFLDSDGNILKNEIKPRKEFFQKYSPDTPDYEVYPMEIIDNQGNKYHMCKQLYCIDEERADIEKYNISSYDYLKIKFPDIITNENIDKSYTFKTKDIGGKTYYAVFKELQGNEKEADFRPHETPSPWAKEGIDKLTEEGLLFNEANCRYTDNISRKDFAFLAVRAFCKAQGMDVDEYIKANNITLDYNKFTDTEDSYILLANYLGIVNGTSETAFSPAKGITRQEAAVMLDNTAKLLGLSPNSEKVNFSDSSYFANWAADAIYSISSIKTPDGTAIMGGTEPEKFSPWMTYTREQAYTTICRLYDTAKK